MTEALCCSSGLSEKFSKIRRRHNQVQFSINVSPILLPETTHGDVEMGWHGPYRETMSPRLLGAMIGWALELCFVLFSKPSQESRRRTPDADAKLQAFPNFSEAN